MVLTSSGFAERASTLSDHQDQACQPKETDLLDSPYANTAIYNKELGP
jgi:hypothetical protein